MSKQTIYSYLKAAGLSRWGALAMMGNWGCESGNEAIRLEGDFDPARRVSKSYADDVDSGRKTRDVFSHDARGWGLAQWTFWSRKQGLYDFCKETNASIGDEYTQVMYALKELREGYPSLLEFLKGCREYDLYNAVCRVCFEYERPAVNNYQVRYDAAKKIGQEVIDEKIAEAYWPPRVLDKNMSGKDVEVLQAILKARGYGVNYISGKFDDLLETESKKFQKNNGLVVDGIVGAKTWAELLKL